MYSMSLHHSGDFELLGSSPFFCASKHLNSKSDAILKLDLVWAFLKAFHCIFLSARKNCVHSASLSSSTEVQPNVLDTASN